MTVKLVKTCSACPEQYDAYNEAGEQIGYLRLRHGEFRVDSPDCGGAVVYRAAPEGDGAFYDHERDAYLRTAVYWLLHYVKTGETFDTAMDKQQADYVIELDH